jgi:hypothetical protein
MTKNQKIVNSGSFSEVVPVKKAETTIEKRKREKRELHEMFEKLEVTGQESEKEGIKHTQDEVKENRRKEHKMEMTEAEWLHSKRKYRDEDYLTALGSMLYHKLRQAELPLGYKTRVEIEGRKIAAYVVDRFGRSFGKGFEACGEVKYDHFAVNRLVIEAENTTDHLEGSDEARKTGNGIYLPPSIKS